MPFFIIAILGVAALLFVEHVAAGEIRDDGTDNGTNDMNNQADANVNAVMALIRDGESSDNYSALVGGGEFVDMTDHPYETGEFAGIRRADGRLTTAAGGYQITVTTWRDIGGVARWGGFNPVQQHEAALFLAARRGALDAMRRGDMETTVAKLRDEWEFFQKWPMSRVKSSFLNHGGVLA